MKKTAMLSPCHRQTSLLTTRMIIQMKSMRRSGGSMRKVSCLQHVGSGLLPLIRLTCLGHPHLGQLCPAGLPLQRHCLTAQPLLLSGLALLRQPATHLHLHPVLQVRSRPAGSRAPLLLRRPQVLLPLPMPAVR